MRATLLLLFSLCFLSWQLSYADDTMPASASASKPDDAIGDNTAKDDQQIYYMYGDIDLATTLKFQYAKPKIVIKSVYPLLHSENEDAAIENLNNIVLQLVKSESEDFKKHVLEQKPAQDNLPKTSLKNDLYIDYDSAFINTQDEHLLSIRFTIAGMIAGSAHGYHYHRVLNYDLDSGETLELADVFQPDVNYLSRLSEYSRKILEKRLVHKEMIISGTEPTLENFRNWNLKPHGLMITFDKYQVAPYVYGAQSVVIPYAALADLIDPDSPVYNCSKNPTRCMRNNLLTGGFIDEAVNTRHRGFNPIFS